MASRVDTFTVDLGIRILNNLYASSELLKNGFYLQAAMMIRDIIETIAVTEYLHLYPDEALAWWKAKTFKERRHFGINSIKDKIKKGEQWKYLWDELSALIHPNGIASSISAADKPYYGHSVFIGGFYYPKSIDLFYSIQLLSSIEFSENMLKWYENELRFSSKLKKDIKSLEKKYRIQEKRFAKRVESENREVVDKVVSSRLPEDRIIEVLKYIDKLSSQ
jgi:hypothetical protein